MEEQGIRDSGFHPGFPLKGKKTGVRCYKMKTLKINTFHTAEA